jgi:hypothetical protein
MERISTKWGYNAGSYSKVRKSTTNYKGEVHFNIQGSYLQRQRDCTFHAHV